MSGILTHSPARIVQQVLIDLDLGTDPQSNLPWPVYATSEPDNPDALIVVKNSQGMDGGRLMEGERQELQGYMLVIRAATNPIAFKKAKAIVTFLEEERVAHRVTTNILAGPGTAEPDISYRVHSFNRRGTVNDVGKGTPNSKRSYYTVNFLSNIEQLT